MIILTNSVNLKPLEVISLNNPNLLEIISCKIKSTNSSNNNPFYSKNIFKLNKIIQIFVKNIN